MIPKRVQEYKKNGVMWTELLGTYPGDDDPTPNQISIDPTPGNNSGSRLIFGGSLLILFVIIDIFCLFSIDNEFH